MRPNLLHIFSFFVAFSASLAIAQPCAQWVERTPASPSPDVTNLIAYDSARERTVVLTVNDQNPSLSATWEWDGSSWSLRNTGGPPVRTGAAMCFDSARNVCVLFGGSTPGTNVYLGDTWEWDGTTWAFRANVGPAPRGSFGLAFDRFRNIAVLFGGIGSTSFPSVVYGDTWEWNGTSWSQRSTTGPSPSFGLAMAYDGLRRRTVLCGGSSLPRETWEWDGVSWVRRSTTGPSAYYSCASYDSARNRVVLFGGIVLYSSPTQYLRNTWEWDGASWTLRSATGPYNSAFHSLAYDEARERTVFFGGSFESGQTWEWDGFSWMLRSGSRPRSRAFHAMTYDPNRKRTLLFGGSPGLFSNNAFGDTWEWDGKQWEFRASSGPMPRTTTAMAYDNARNVVTMFGGFGLSGQPLNDTWEWDGSAWVPRPAIGPAARGNHSLVFDNHYFISRIFGGTGSSGLLGDTWSWDGTSWTNTGVIGPIARTNRAMSFDALRNRCVLFGGSGVQDLTTYLGDTWEFDGTAWQFLDVEGPSARYRTASVFDSARGAVVLFGGGQASSYVNELWEWNGGAWNLRNASGIPPLGGHGMAYDSNRDTIVVFGGLNNSGGLSGRVFELERGEPSPAIIRSPTSPFVCAGSTLSLRTIANGTGVIAYQWRKNGVPLAEGPRIRDTNKSTLLFLGAEVGDSGTYDCLAVDDCGAVTSSPGILTVYAAGSADMNLDDVVDGLDIGVFVEALVGYEPVTAGLCAADLTGDGVVDLSDVSLFVNRLVGV